MNTLVCAECDKTFPKPKSLKPSKSGLRFCSRICGINYWGRNRKRSGPKPQGSCEKCGESVHARIKTCAKCLGNKITGNCHICNKKLNRRNISGYCKPCRDKKLREESLNKPISEFLYKNRGATNKYTRLREFSRRLVKEAVPLKDMKCCICEYAFYVEVCHILDASGFGEHVPVKIANSLSNLTILCPNHHKEFDKGQPLNIIPVQELPCLYD